VSTSDVRLLRRIVRDVRTRGYDAEATLTRWPSVRSGEETYIFPHQESADMMFNSALVYEVHVLKSQACKALRRVGTDSPMYGEACRLIDLLAFFEEAESTPTPPASILREFVGGSAFADVR